MQNRLVKHKILGKNARFRSEGDFDPMSFAMNAIAQADGSVGQTSGAGVAVTGVERVTPASGSGVPRTGRSLPVVSD
jgi:hypothetical protein